MLIIISGAVCFYAGMLTATKMGLTYAQTSAPITKAVQAILAATNQKPKVSSE